MMCFDPHSRDQEVGKAVEAAEHFQRGVNCHRPVAIAAFRGHELVHSEVLNGTELSNVQMATLLRRAFHRGIQGSHSGATEVCVMDQDFPDGSGYISDGQLTIAFSGGPKAHDVACVILLFVVEPELASLAMQT